MIKKALDDFLKLDAYGYAYEAQQLLRKNYDKMLKNPVETFDVIYKNNNLCFDYLGGVEEETLEELLKAIHASDC